MHELAESMARTILEGFDRHYAFMQAVTAGARSRFERTDWPAVQEAARRRIFAYDKRVAESVTHLREAFGTGALDEPLWQRIKLRYVALLHRHSQPELAETFYNSVFCRLFHRKYYNNANIFVRPAVSTEHLDSDPPAYRCHYPAREGFGQVLAAILDGAGLGLPFADRRRDLRNLLAAIRARVPDHGPPHQNLQVAVLRAPFFRNKAAYIIGKLINGPEAIPFAIPILNDERGRLYVDTLLAGEEALANLFSFARSYFMVDTEVPAAVVDFLSRILPCKTKADLYTAIGLQKHGKTEFYRDFLHHLRHSSDQFIVAPGARGMVMTVFTLPSYPYVFKVIRDRFAPPKDTTREAVMAKYQLVKQHDRVGRMADSWEYSQAAFPRARFSPALLRELEQAVPASIEHDGDQVVISHVYIERRMVPLDIYLDAAAPPALRDAVGEYGDALKELAAANIFPGDLLFKNFGVTRGGRVVFYDYDEIRYLTDCRFRHVPEAPYPELEMADEPWYAVEPGDVFPEEFAAFLLTHPRVREAFLALHADLLDPDFWRAKQAAVRAGHFEDVFPYPADRRFSRRPRPQRRRAAPAPRAPAAHAMSAHA